MQAGAGGWVVGAAVGRGAAVGAGAGAAVGVGAGAAPTGAGDGVATAVTGTTGAFDAAPPPFVAAEVTPAFEETDAAEGAPAGVADRGLPVPAGLPAVGDVAGLDAADVSAVRPASGAGVAPGLSPGVLVIGTPLASTTIWRWISWTTVTVAGGLGGTVVVVPTAAAAVAVDDAIDETKPSIADALAPPAMTRPASAA